MTFSLTGARSAVRQKAANGSHHCSTVPQNVKAACGVLFNDLMELFRDRPEEGRETRFIFYCKFFNWPRGNGKGLITLNLPPPIFGCGTKYNTYLRIPRNFAKF